MQLGDGKTYVPIMGIGTAQCQIDGHLIINNVQYNPGLSESIYSLFLHIQTPKHGLSSSDEDGLFIPFLAFKTKVVVGQNDIYLNVLPMEIKKVLENWLHLHQLLLPIFTVISPNFKQIYTAGKEIFGLSSS